MQQPRANTSKTLRAGNALFDQPHSGTPQAFAASTNNQIFLLPNDKRTMASVFNNSTAILYLSFGSFASPTAHTVAVPPSALYELPSDISGVWKGYLSGACDAVSPGQIQVTET